MWKSSCIQRCFLRFPPTPHRCSYLIPILREYPADLAPTCRPPAKHVAYVTQALGQPGPKLHLSLDSFPNPKYIASSVRADSPLASKMCTAPPVSDTHSQRTRILLTESALLYTRTRPHEGKRCRWWPQARPLETRLSLARASMMTWLKSMPSRQDQGGLRRNIVITRTVMHEEKKNGFQGESPLNRWETRMVCSTRPVRRNGIQMKAKSEGGSIIAESGPG